MRLLQFLTTFLLIINFTTIYGQTVKTDSINLVLDSIYQTDQSIRFKLISLQKKRKMQTDEFRNTIIQMKKIDAENLDKVKSILDNYEWPENLTQQANQTIFLVIQHADLETQKQYLPLVRKAVEEGKTLPSNLALLEDRMALREGKKQIYGSQVFIDSETGNKYVQPLKNPETVDERRAKVGLLPMSDYLKQSFQMEWSVEQYKKDLPKIKKLLEERKN